MNTSTPLVSIIIPTYNRAHLIGETLDSVLAQTYTHWECIVVDDGSSDNTDEVVGDYVKKDPRFKYYHRPDTHLPGGNGARNYGFLQSKGEYIQWFDSDDLMLNVFIEEKISLFNAQVQIVISKRLENGKVLRYKSMEESKLYISDFDRQYIVNRYSILTGDVMFLKNVINQSFDENLQKAQEMEFFTRVFNQDLCYVFTDKVLWNHRVFSDSISSNSDKNLIKKVDSLIYLSKKLQTKYVTDFEALKTIKNYGKVLYKSLMIKNNFFLVLRNYHYYRKCYNVGVLTFSFFFIYNTVTKRGFYLLKKLEAKCFAKI